MIEDFYTEKNFIQRGLMLSERIYVTQKILFMDNMLVKINNMHFSLLRIPTRVELLSPRD